jgi:hypothetical protein
MNATQALHAFTDQVKGKPFRPGSHDCGMFAAAWVKYWTGRDVVVGLRGKYRTLKKAQEMFEARGFKDHVDFAASLFADVHPAFAQIGDLAVVDGDALGIVAGENVYVLKPTGLSTVSRLRATRAFTIGGAE